MLMRLAISYLFESISVQYIISFSEIICSYANRYAWFWNLLMNCVLFNNDSVLDIVIY